MHAMLIFCEAKLRSGSYFPGRKNKRGGAPISVIIAPAYGKAPLRDALK